MSNIFVAIKTVFSDRRYAALGILIAAIVFSTLFAIQVKTVPGNDSRFQIALFGWKDWFILVAISALNAIFITIEVYVFNLRRSTAKLAGVSVGLASGGIGTSSGILASIFSTASCSLCVSAIFGFLGANSVIFLVAHRVYFVAGALILLFMSLYLSGKRFGHACNECRVDFL